jgi:periplasmic copper chaperone A
VGPLTRAASSHVRRSVAVLAPLVVLLGACASGDHAASGKISTSDVWALATATGQPNGAVYLTITSSSGDTLEQVTVPDAIADHAELHEEVTTASGAMTMQEMSAGVPLAAGEAVTFAPGGKHVMLVDLTKPLVTGETFDITLDFAKADPITLPVAVVETAP